MTQYLFKICYELLLYNRIVWKYPNKSPHLVTQVPSPNKKDSDIITVDIQNDKKFTLAGRTFLMTQIIIKK